MPKPRPIQPEKLTVCRASGAWFQAGSRFRGSGPSLWSILR
jgi:hypothetical protein